ncbi:hypothetical protein ANTRET_LOCUS4090 [Anthophora retusa]
MRLTTFDGSRMLNGVTSPLAFPHALMVIIAKRHALLFQEGTFSFHVCHGETRVRLVGIWIIKRGVPLAELTPRLVWSPIEIHGPPKKVW